MSPSGDRCRSAGGRTRDSGDIPGDHRATTLASEAFGSLGSETRMEIVRTLADGEPSAFSDLYGESDEDTSAGFAYHLRQLRDRFVRQREDERYELTAAGRTVARDVQAGTYTRSVDHDPVDLPDACPFCETAPLRAAVTDNVTEVACSRCEVTLLRVALSPGAYTGRDDGDFVAALDSHHRRRIDSFADGVCPNCAGPVARSIATGAETDAPPARDADSDGHTVDSADSRRVQARFACETCGETLRCPVALTLLSHPTVVSFYHDHGEDVRERPIWSVGPEWRECLISSDPWCVGVSTHLDDESLFLYLDRERRVVDHRRRAVVDASASENDDSSGDDDPDGGDRRPIAASVETKDVEPPSTGDSELDHSQATDGATA